MNRHSIAVLATIGIVFVSGFMSYFSCNWSTFSRAGALIIVSGIVIEYWQVLKTFKADDMPFWRSQEAHESARVAILLVCLGTVISSYGDMLGNEVKRCVGN